MKKLLMTEVGWEVSLMTIVAVLVLFSVVTSLRADTGREEWPSIHVRVRAEYDSATVNQSCNAFPGGVFLGGRPQVAGFDVKLLGKMDRQLGRSDSVNVQSIPGTFDQDTIWKLDMPIPCIPGNREDIERHGKEEINP